MKFRVGVVALILGALSLTGIAPAREAYDQHRRIEQSEKKLAALKNENARLEERLTRLKDPDYVEKLAREQLGLVKPGETAYVVVAPPPPTSTVAGEPEKPRSFVAKSWTWLKQLFS